MADRFAAGSACSQILKPLRGFRMTPGDEERGSGIPRHAIINTTMLVKTSCKRISLLLILASVAVAQQDPPFRLNPRLYNPFSDPKAEIAEAIKDARQDHKRILLVFGGNWCLDCHVLDYRFHQMAIRPLVDDNFHVVHVDIGQYNRNLEIAQRYGTSLKKGVPAVAVLSSTGRLLFGQTNGEFEKASKLDPAVIIEFLNKWKPPGR
ncbi:MAG: thioredoxin family protein [Acidobacteria bacterium]|nr:thioredoxin family protein [Acidobacteriota bacterium]